MLKSKEEIRKYIWDLLESKDVADFPRPVHGRIPNFKGSRIAAERISKIPEFEKSSVIKVNPDAPQQRIREIALSRGKILIMPTPRIREGFLLLDPKKIPFDKYKKASTIKGAFQYGMKYHPRELPNIDFIVLGSVAVSMDGSRIGKGEGYGELEFAILLEYGKIDREIKIATSVHDLQIIDQIPLDPFDVSVDYIATPTTLIRIKQRPPRPSGIIWELLSEEKIKEIPLLYELKKIQSIK